ncbi:MAG: tRNA (adenosine(37)-N6)-threonylcarbamoyltransferase complex transferase subunit TsaD [Myxococcota bacterium]
MLILGIETSCDETAAALLAVEGGRPSIRANVVSSQHEVHGPYGGVVPELASRHHVTNLVPVLDEAMRRAGATLADVDALAVTRGPGLVGALLVGVQAAKAIAFARGLPLVGVHHLDGHLAAVELDGPTPHPHVALLVSGGHTALFHVRAPGAYGLLGQTRDDAAGEAFDKVGKLLGLPYPGGPAIERAAAGGDPAGVKLPRALPGRDCIDFSFSGLKTAVAAEVARRGGIPPVGQALADLCASFQQAVVDVVVRKARVATRRARADTLVAAGGVLANRAIRAALEAAGREDGFALRVPPIALCTDNAAMIAAAGARRLARGERDGLDLCAVASLPLA